MSSATGGVACATMPTGPTGITVFYSQAQPLTSQVFVTSYYNNDVTDCILRSSSSANRLAARRPLPRALRPKSTVLREWQWITTGMNVFVANAGANTITVYGAGTALSNPPDFHPA